MLAVAGQLVCGQLTWFEDIESIHYNMQCLRRTGTIKTMINSRKHFYCFEIDFHLIPLETLVPLRSCLYLSVVLVMLVND